MQTALDTLAEHPFATFAIWLLVIAAAIWTGKKQRGLRAAKRLVDLQHTVAHRNQIAVEREDVPAALRSKWDAMIALARGPAGTNPIRVGHLAWAMEMAEQDCAPATAPTFEPPAGTPYDVMHDPGMQHVADYMIALTQGDVIRAYDHLQAGAEIGSPMCMTTYGACLLEGRVPGRDPEPGAVIWLEKAIQAGDSPGSLATFLVEGKFVQQDLERGLRLMKDAAAGGQDTARVELGAIYERGLFGVPPDQEEAIRWVLPLASWPRRLLASLGVSPAAWVNLVVQVHLDLKAKAETEGHWDRQRAMKKLMARMSR